MPETTWDLGNGFLLREADIELFARFHAFYRQDPFLRDQRADLFGLFCEGSPCHWIERNGQKVAGALAGGGVVGQFFAIPPHAPLLPEVMRRVVAHVRGNAGGRIFAHGVTEDELDGYFRLGFRPTAAIAHQLAGEEPDYSWQSMRMMVRPVEATPAAPCAAELRAPRQADAAKIAALLRRAYGGGDPMRQSIAHFREDVDQFFMQDERAMRRASSVAVREGAMVGVCMVVRWEGQPLIFDIAVDPQERKGGIATAMIARAVDALHASGETQLRLFLECGNPAELLYDAMGFWAGPKTASMYLD